MIEEDTPPDTVDSLLAEAVALNNRFDGRPATATAVNDVLIRLLTLMVEAKRKK